jgi:DNA-binding transcriptional LysR family regulator
VQTLNFSEAARRNGLTQPAISHHINELEKQLGCQLFVRSKRNVTITEAGKQFLPYAADMVELAEEAAIQMRQIEEGYEGSISISAVPTSSEILCRCLGEFAQRWPNILVDISVTSPRGQMIQMNESKFDFHFAKQDMVPPGETFDSLITNVGRLCLVLPKNHPMADQPLDFSALKNDHFISVSETESPPLARMIKKICRVNNYKPNIICKYDRAEAVVLAVGAGLGISILPDAIGKISYSENVIFIEIPGDDSVSPDVVAWPKKLTNPSAKHFLEVVQKLYGKKQ